jgi:hypothetical protein
LNNFYYYNHDLKSNNSLTGFMGIGGGPYYKSGKNKGSLSVGFISGQPTPIGYYGGKGKGTSTKIYCVLTEAIWKRTIAGNVNFTGGLNYANYIFRLISYEDTISSYTANDKTIGVTLGVGYEFFNSLEVAITYRPSLIALNTKQNWHTISLEVQYSPILWRKK